MKKFILLLTCFFCLSTSIFAQETDNTYWTSEVDTEGNLFTVYLCKTDAQFNNTFKNIVKEQLGISFSLEEPNWNSIQNGWISEEGIRRKFPRFYKSIVEHENVEFNWNNYKYRWVITNLNGGYLVLLRKRVNGTDYYTFSSVNNSLHFWKYTTEVLTYFEYMLKLAEESDF